MKTLLYRVRLINGEEQLDPGLLFFSYLCKALMILAIAFFVFLLTSKNYSSASFSKNEIISSEQVTTHPPSPFE